MTIDKESIERRLDQIREEYASRCHVPIDHVFAQVDDFLLGDGGYLEPEVLITVRSGLGAIEHHRCPLIPVRIGKIPLSSLGIDSEDF